MIFGPPTPTGASMADGHRWTLVIVSSQRTSREARRFLEGERRVYRKFDLQNAEDVSSVGLMCADCRFAPDTPEDMLFPCKGPRDEEPA